MSVLLAFDPLLAALLATVWLVAAWRGWKAHGGFRAARLALQTAMLILLGALLMLRDAPAPRTLVVYTEDAVIAGDAAATRAAWRVSLPGAASADGVEAAPDLATALRRHAPVEAVHVIGRGLAPHDLAALGSRALSFEPAQSGTESTLLALDAPAVVRAGVAWQLQGQVGPAVEAVELRDPADRRVARAAPDADGRFVLRGVARRPGEARFSLSLRVGEQEQARIPVPVWAESPAPLRVMLRAAVPSPETRALRRWAVDAGVDLSSEVGLAPGVSQRRGEPALTADALDPLDLLIIDERSLPRLAASVPAIRAAIDDGLGLLLRVTGPLSPRAAAIWNQIGPPLQLAPDAHPEPLQLEPGDAADEALHAWPVSLSAAHAMAWRDASGRALAVWRAQGRGRVGAVWLADSFRLVTRGQAVRHATRWSDLVGTLARARDEAMPRVQGAAWRGWRLAVCGDGAPLHVIAPDGQHTPLAPDPQAGRCAAFWPEQSGWHRVEYVEPGSTSLATDTVVATRIGTSLDAGSATTVAASSAANAASATQVATGSDGAPVAATRFLVRDPADHPDLWQAQIARDTHARVTAAAPRIHAASTLDSRRLALFLAWLACAALLWWLERRLRAAR